MYFQLMKLGLLIYSMCRFPQIKIDIHGALKSPEILTNFLTCFDINQHFFSLAPNETMLQTYRNNSI